MKTLHANFNKQTGVSMVEVLVTMVILLVGLLGLAGLQLHAQRSEMESYQRVQALILLQDMVTRINSNRLVTTYKGKTAGKDSTVCTDPFLSSTQDLCQWHNAIVGAAGSTGDGIGAVIDGRGCISYDATTEAINTTPKPIISRLDGANITTLAGAPFLNSGTYTVSVAWQGLGKTVERANLCGKGLYGDDAQRRVVSKILRIAPLG